MRYRTRLQSPGLNLVGPVDRGQRMDSSSMKWAAGKQKCQEGWGTCMHGSKKTWGQERGALGSSPAQLGV